MSLDQSLIADRVLDLIREIAVDPPQVESDLIEDLGFDSLDTVELVLMLQNEFDVQISDEDTEKCAKVSDVIALIQQKQA